MQQNQTIEDRVVELSRIDRFYMDSFRATLVPGSEYYFAETKHARMKEKGKPASVFTKAYDYAIAGVNEALRIAAYPCGAALLYQGLKSFGLF